MQSPAYWKWKIEHIWYSFEEQVRIYVIIWEICTCLWAALWRSSLMHVCSKKQYFCAYEQVNRLKYKLWGHSHAAVITCRVPVCPLPNQFQSARFQSWAARPTTYRWPKLFPLQQSGHNQSVYINKNIKKNWDNLFFLPSKYKKKDLITEQGLLLVWHHLYKCSLRTPGCVPSWISSRPKYKGA